MKFIEPEQFTLPRAYFTGFDRIAFTQYEMDLDELREVWLNLERKIKLLSLIKGHLVIAASHFIESELAQTFVMTNPALLEKDIIVPALISDYQDFTQFLDAKRESPVESELYSDKRPSVEHGYPRPSEVVDLLNRHANSVVAWDVAKASDYFKRSFLRDLRDGNSVLRHNLDKEGVAECQIEEVAKEVESMEVLSRKHVYFAAAKSPSKVVRYLVPEYADFKYYLSGAIAVNSEGVLPQENFIDFSLTDLVGRKTRLSECDIFYRILVGIVESQVHRHFPTDVLDRLSFADIVDLRKSFLGKSFIEKYNGMVALAKAGLDVSDPERLILNLNELMAFEQELRELFTECVKVEVYQQEALRSASSGARILTNVAELVSFYGTLQSTVSLVLNLMSYFGLDQYRAAFEGKLGSRLRDLLLFVDGSSLLKKPIILEFLSQVVERYKAKLV